MSGAGITRRLFMRGSAASVLLVGCAAKTGLVRDVYLLGDGDEQLPSYSALTANPQPAIPEALAAAEKSDLLIDDAQALQKRLFSGPERPRDDQPLFVFFVSAEKVGVVTFSLGLFGACIPVFMSPVDAGEYRRLLLRNMKTRYMVSSATQFLKMLRDVETAGVKMLAFNRPPRGGDFAELATRALQTPNDVIEIWSIHRGKQMALLKLYLAFGLKEARAGRLEVARDVGLACAGHITLGEPRLHLLLGQVAVALRDRVLVGEAGAYLKLLRDDARVRLLDRSAAAGIPDFSVEAFV
jgi:hypothetical protein